MRSIRIPAEIILTFPTQVKVTDEIAESLGLEKATGALIASITEESPAKEAGLESGDIILEFNGHVVESMKSLPRLVAETPIDTEIEVVYLRDWSSDHLTALRLVNGRVKWGGDVVTFRRAM